LRTYLYSPSLQVHGRKKLGKGSYGSVYLATHRATADERAVKVMNVDRVTSYYLRKLHTEIAILKEVDHPNIIKLHEVFFGRRSVYLVTDLCRGGELFELLSSGKNQGFVFREDRAASLLRDMLRAVRYLHSKGIVHRDLKLENFLFEGDSSSSPLVLIDFGLSKHYDPHERMRQRVGSCYYTAPEVLNGDYDYRCDLWSLGVICYMLLSGTPPFGGKTPDDIHSSTLTKTLAFPERAFRHVSPVSVDFLSRLLVKDPCRRMTAEEALQHPFIALAAQGAAALPPVPPPAATATATAALGMPPPPGAAALPSAGRPLSGDQANKLLSCCVAFAESSSITRLLLCMVSFSMSWEKTLEFRSEFFALDSDGSGTLSFAEFSRIAACLPYGVSEKKMRAVFNRMTLTDVETIALANARRSDADLSLLVSATAQLRGTKLKEELQYREFIAAALYHRLPIEQERFLLTFDHLDCDKEGVLTSASLQQMLGRDLTVHDSEMCMMSAMAMLNASPASGGGARNISAGGVTSATLRRPDFEAFWLRYLEARPQDVSMLFSGVPPRQQQQAAVGEREGRGGGEAMETCGGDGDGGGGGEATTALTHTHTETETEDSMTLIADGDQKGFFGRPSSLKAAASSVFSCLR
jgi:calcium-dependent protein kinase